MTRCEACEDDIDYPSAILFGAPNSHDQSLRMALCDGCYKEVYEFLRYLTFQSTSA